MVHLRARYVFPVSADPIPGGVVSVDRGRIVAVGAGARGPVHDLGNVALLPGLVNAHTHLELSDVPVPLGRPGMPLPEWIGQVIRFRREWARPPAERVALGRAECRRYGVTTVADITQPGSPAADEAPSAPLVIPFLELIAPTRARVPSALAAAAEYVSVAGLGGRPAGLSPHAPYSVRMELLDEVAALSRRHRVPLAMHLAESPEELELLRTGGGPFRTLLEMLGGWEDGAQPAGRQPLDYLRRLAEADRALVIHGNYLDDEEIAFLGQHAGRLATVYCPRSHAWFGHRPYPLPALLEAGATVAVGTDSRASTPDLSVLAELRHIAQLFPELPGAAVLALGTLSGARALGQADERGSLEPGKRADLTAVALPTDEAGDPHELLFEGELPVVAVWVAGQMVSPP